MYPWPQPFTNNQALETRLTPSQELSFQEWAPLNVSIGDQIQGLTGQGDYDWRGFYLNPVGQSFNEYDQTIHSGDRYKKPTHPTFTGDSMYAPFGNPGMFMGNGPFWLAPEPNPTSFFSGGPRIIEEGRF